MKITSIGKILADNTSLHELLIRLGLSVIVVSTGSIMFSCTDKAIVGHWQSMPLSYTKDDKVNCFALEFDLVMTESGKYFGKGIINGLDCVFQKPSESTKFQLTRIRVDMPVVEFVIVTEREENYVFSGLLEDSGLRGDLVFYADNDALTLGVQFKKE